MFKILKSIRKVSGNINFYKNNVIYLVGDYKHANIIILDQKFNIVKKFRETTSDYIIVDDQLIFTTQVISVPEKIMRSYKYLLNSGDQEPSELDFTLHLKGHKYNYIYLCLGSKGNAKPNKERFYFKIDLKEIEIKSSLDEDIGLIDIEAQFEDSFISTDKWQGKIGKFDFQNKRLWQKDISELGTYQEGNDIIKGEVNNVYTDDIAVYVLTGLSIIAFDLDTGAMLWHTELDTYQSRGLLKDGYLYTTSNAYINKIEIASGAIVYQKKLSGVTVQDELQEMPIANLTWHKDYIWAIMDTSPNALLKIDPNTGLYAEVLDLGTLGIMRHCHDPKFYQNRMYLLDYDQTLHICEEEALT